MITSFPKSVRTITIDTSIYSLECVLKAAYTATGKAFVHQRQKIARAQATHERLVAPFIQALNAMHAAGIIPNRANFGKHVPGFGALRNAKVRQQVKKHLLALQEVRQRPHTIVCRQPNRSEISAPFHA